MEKTIVKVENLVKRYKELVALDHFNLEISEGEIFGLLGPNGSGKTTTINCILSLLSFDKGKIELFGKEITPDSYDIKKNIGVLPARKQKYARQVLDDVKSGILIVEEGKTFLTYIQEYSDRAIKKMIKDFVGNFGIDAEAFYHLYINTIDGKVDTIKLEEIEKTADIYKAKEYFDIKSILSVRGKLHTELKTFVEEQKAEPLD